MTVDNSALTNIALSNNNLNALPDGLFTGLPALTTLYLHDNPTNPLPLTVTVEKVGTDQVRAKVLTGAPFAVNIPVTVVDGTLAAGATMLRVAAGAVEGTAVTVTRTAGTTAAVTVDVDLSTQPTKPSGSHRGYAFARASSSLPATILPDETPTIPPGLEVTLQLSHDRILEFPSPVTVTAIVSPASPVAFTVTISATPVAPATADDFTLSTNRVLRFAADATESTGTVRITPVDDDIPEPHDVVRVSGAVSNAAIPDPDDVTVEIINNDPEDYDVEVSAPPAVDEGAGAAVVTLTLTTQKNTAPVATVDMFFNVEGGTATRGDDYTPPPGRDFGTTGIHFASVQPSAFSPNAAGTAWVAEPSFTIGIIDDQEAEVAETIVFTVKFSEVETPAHTITIRDNDAVASDRTTGLEAAAKSPTVIQLSWTAPSAGSFSITGYRVEASENARGPWVVVAADTRNTRPSWGHGGLSAGDTRHYRVSAISPAGTSGPSNVASATTIAAGPAGTNAALPPPQDVNAEPKLPGEIRLSWWRNPNDASHDLVDRHQYRYRVRNAGAWTVDWTTVDQTQTMPPPGTTETRNYNSVLLQELTAGTTYEFQVRSMDTADGTSAAVAALGTATGRQTVWIVADVGSVAEGEPLRFTVWRDQRHGPMVAIVRISETGDMLPPDGRSPKGYWHEQVHFGDGNERIPLVLETVNDGGGTEPDSRVTVEVMPHPLYPDNPDNEYLYDVQPGLGQAKITVTAAAGGSSSGTVAEPLTAAFEGLPEAHDGETAFTFRLAFSEAVAVTPEAMRTHVLTVEGGAVTGAVRVDGESGVWAITVTPATREELSITLAPAAECAADGAVCTADGRALSNGAAHIVSGTGPAPLTATFPESVYASAQHKGPSDRPQVVVAFSAPVAAFGADTPSVSATGASVDGVQRLDKEGLENAYVFFLTPEGQQAIVFRLHANRACTDGGICTADRRRLSNSPSATIPGPSDDAAEPNTAATGAPTISGTPQVGEELTASTSGISDADGLDDASFGYQWIRAGADIGGATGATYTPVAADEGTRLKVRVSFTDDTGHEERLTSAATDAVTAAPESGSAAEPLTASFEGMPVEHAGQGSFSFRVAFSDGISVSYTRVRDASFQVTAGEVTAARRIDGRRDLWEITIEPDSDETVTVRLPETIACAASGAICTGDGRPLSHSLSATVAGPAGEPERNTAAAGAPTVSGTPQVGEELTASTSGVSDADGLDNASFGYQWIRTGADIGGATGSTYTPVAADEGKRLKVRVSFTDDAGHEESLTSAATDAVAAASEPLTASFEGVPAEHAGQGSFSFRVAFSDGISISYKTVRDASFRVTGGAVTQANRVDGRRDLWRIKVEPDSDEAVTVRLPETTDCGASGAVCTGDGQPLSHSLSATVSGPVGISVADARVEEGAGAVLAFAVTLSRAAAEQVTVDYQTVNGTAAAGTDYTAANGTLTFAAGDTEETVEVAVLDDSHDEGEETMTLRLSNPSEGRLADAEATGTIENTDPLPRALLARFGRATALHVMEQVEERLEASRASGFRGRFAGRELRRGMERDMGRNFLSRLESTAGAGARDTMGGQSDLSPTELLRRGLGGGDLLMGSGFVLNRETGAGASVSLWSRGMESRFSGRDGELSLDGGVRTTMFGADYAKGPLMAGLMLSHRRGLGGYQGADIGQVASSVTGLHPWVGYQLTERVTLWGVTGYGRGSLSLTPGEAVSLPTSLAAPVALEGGLSMSMLAGGVRGDLLDGGVGGFGLAFKADALWVGTGSEAVDGPAGRLAGTEAVVTRVRTALEASRGYVFGHGIALRPSLEVGLRQDGGDAETGAGADVAASLIASDPLTGLSVDVRVRTLLVHQDEGFRERGVSVSFSYDPTPSTPLGFTARVAPSWGGQAMSGADALWGRDTMEGLGAGGPGSGDRIDAELGYALPVGSRLVGTPRFGVTTSEYGRGYRLGYSLAVVQGGAMSFQFGLDAQRRESLLQEKPDHSLVGRLTVGW